MSESMRIYTLERTIVSQANELVNLREGTVKWIDQYNSAEKRFQTEHDRREQCGEQIEVIRQILDGDKLALEEQLDTIGWIVAKWDEMEEIYGE